MNIRGHMGMAALCAAVYQYSYSPYEYNGQHPLFLFGCMFAALAGGKAPDYDLLLVDKNANYIERSKIHRQTTHSIVLIIGLTYIAYQAALKNYQMELAVYFCVGLVSHLIADVVTGTIPILFYGDPRKPFRRIGIKIDPIKRLFVKLGDWLGYPVAGIACFQMYMFHKDGAYNVLDKLSWLTERFNSATF